MIVDLKNGDIINIALRNITYYEISTIQDRRLLSMMFIGGSHIAIADKDSAIYPTPVIEKEKFDQIVKYLEGNFDKAGV